jgi:mono/diheme cytochrome c family protein
MIVVPAVGIRIALIALGPLTCLGDDLDDAKYSRAREVWVEDCADCHGLTGRADGQLAAGLDPPAPDFRDPCRKITDEWIERVILSGGASYGGSAAMKAHHELRYDAVVLRQLVTYVQALREPGPCTEVGNPQDAVVPEPG